MRAQIEDAAGLAGAECAQYVAAVIDATPRRRHHCDASGSRFRPGFCGSRAVPEWFHWISGRNRLM